MTDLSKNQAGQAVDLSKNQAGQAGAPANKAKKRGPARIIAILAIVALAAGIISWRVAAQRANDEARAAFGLLMDRLAGPGRWTAKTVTYSSSKKSMTAKSLALDVRDDSHGVSAPVTIEEIEIVNGLRRDELESLLSVSDWRGQPDKHLADLVAVRGAKVVIDDKKELTTITLGEIGWSGIDLVAAGPETEEGALGLLKSARVQKAWLAGVNLTVAGPAQEQVKATLEKIESTDLRLSPEMSALSPAWRLLADFSQGSLILTGFELNVAHPDGSETLKLTAGEQSQKGAGRLKYDSVDYKDLGLSLNIRLDPGADAVTKVEASAGELHFKDVDVNPLVEKFYRQIRFSDPSEGLEERLSKLSTVADLVALPYSLGEALVRDVSINVNDALAVSLALATYTGPAEAGVIAPSQSWGLVGLKVDLPTSETGTDLDKAFKFGQEFGQSSFTLGYDVKSTYQAETGALEYIGAPALGIDDLASINIEAGFAGLTPELVRSMASVPLVEAHNAWFLPGFVDVGISRFRLEIKDSSLVDKILALYGAKMGQDKEVVRTLAAISAAAYLGFAEGSLENAAALGQLASEFILHPGKLSVEISPVAPLSASSAYGADSQVELLNSLNAVVTVNSEPPLALKFIEPPEEAAPEGPGEDEGDDGEDDDGLEGLEGLGQLQDQPAPAEGE